MLVPVLRYGSAGLALRALARDARPVMHSHVMPGCVFCRPAAGCCLALALLERPVQPACRGTNLDLPVRLRAGRQEHKSAARRSKASQEATHRTGAACLKSDCNPDANSSLLEYNSSYSQVKSAVHLPTTPSNGRRRRGEGCLFGRRPAWLRRDNRRRWRQRCSRACAEWPRQRVANGPALKPKASADGPRQRQGRQWTIVCARRWLRCARQRRGEAAEEVPPAPVGSRGGGATRGDGGGHLLDSGRTFPGGCTRVSRGGCARVDRGLDPKRNVPDQA